MGGDPHPNERRAAAKGNHVRKPEGAVRRGQGGNEKERIDCVQSDIRAFVITGDWKATALKAAVWTQTVTEDGRRFMVAWRKKDVDAVRHRQKKKEATRLENLLSHTEA